MDNLGKNLKIRPLSYLFGNGPRGNWDGPGYKINLYRPIMLTNSFITLYGKVCGFTAGMRWVKWKTLDMILKLD